MSLALTPANIPSKFYPYLLGHPACSSLIKSEIDMLLQDPKSLSSIKGDHILDGGSWVIKERRTETSTPIQAADTHIYRIRKAEKIKAYIEKENLLSLVEIPKKYLYWHEKEKKFYVVCQKLELLNAVLKPGSKIEKEINNLDYDLSTGQIRAYKKKESIHIKLTAEQAKLLAELSFRCGLIDLTYNNLFFSKDKRIAILDTEPVKRTFKKQMKSTYAFYFFGDMNVLKLNQGLIGTALLKSNCSDTSAKNAVKRVELNHVCRGVARQVTKATIIVFLIYSVAPLLETLSITSRMVTNPIESFLWAKVGTSLFMIFEILQMYHYSYKEDLDQVEELVKKGWC